MNSFLKVYRSATRYCVAFNYQQRTSAVLNWIQLQTTQSGGNFKFVTRNVTYSNLLDSKALSPVFEIAVQFQPVLTTSWLSMKTKEVKHRGDSSNLSRREKHKSKRSKKKSKVKAKQVMASVKSTVQDDGSSSDSDILIVFEAKKPQKPKKIVEEIILDNDNINHESCHTSQASLEDIPLPQEKYDALDLALIPLPSLPERVQSHFPRTVNVQEQISLAEFQDVIRPPETEDLIADNSDMNIYDYENEVRESNARMQEIRKWDKTGYGQEIEDSGTQEGTFFSVMSYNVLAQKLLEDHEFLYRYHDVRTLTWDHRRRTLINEFRVANADVLCLQEVQFDHLQWFNDQLSELGYVGLYKRRTHDHVDGCAIYFKRDRFRVVESSSVEYNQPNVEVLNRDNVGLIARLEVVGTDQQLVIATTHLLFNPRRHDIKLAQMQLLLTELERIAYLEYDRRSERPIYRPVIITGDFNLQPNSAVYRFITDGFINYSILAPRTLKPTYSRYVQEYLLPPDLQVSNTCQHVGIIQHRQNTRHDTQEGLLNELRLLKLFNSDNATFLKEHGPCRPSRSFDEFVRHARRDGCVNNFVPNFNGRADDEATSSNTNDMEGMEPGMLSHAFPLKSVYSHYKRKGFPMKESREATTHQQSWVTVDYIFYSGRWSQTRQETVEGPLKLISRFRLPSEEQCDRELKHIPNMACGSDHLPLLARFLLRS